MYLEIIDRSRLIVEEYTRK